MEHLEGKASIYKQIVEKTKVKLQTIKNKTYRISIIRVILFTAGIAGLIYVFNSSWMAIVGVVAITFVPFLALIKYHNQLFYQKEYLEKKIEINEQEIAALNYDYSAFEDGEEFINSAHLYSYDLDLFGKKSLFQYINRTSTSFGKTRLASWLNNHLDNKQAIEERQTAVQELTPLLKFRQQIRILGSIYKGEAADGNEIETWAKTQSIYKEKAFYKLLPIIVPSINLLIAILAALGIISFNLLGLSFVFFVTCSIMLTKSISKIQASYGKRLQILATYAGIIQKIEQETFTSQALINIQQQLQVEGHSASQAVNKLAKLMNTLDQRNNILVTTILNGLLFWELKQVIKIESWKEEHAEMLPVWLEAVGDMDALCSLATFAYNQSEYTFPEIKSEPFSLTARQMGHPLMNRNKCVKNDINIIKKPYFVIITGANMAGKSTYLRTIGVNYLLACIGAPVCAKEMQIYPSHLITSLRTTDSLTENESYFFAELKRLKLIIDKLNNGEELFIILDEILKGTNSMDKQKGSFALIKQFMTLKANGIIATHDLLLGSLIDLFPSDIHNYCFEAEIKNNELSFAYQLKEGVAQNMNACFLMKKMGIAMIEE